MNFFAMDKANSRIVGTSMLWIFVVSSVVITAVTFLFYYWLLHRDGVAFRRLAPKVSLVPDWNIQALKRQLRASSARTDTKLQDLQA